MDISKALWPGLITPAISAASPLGLGAGEDCRVAAAIFGEAARLVSHYREARMMRCATNRDCFHGSVMPNFSTAALIAKGKEMPLNKKAQEKSWRHVGRFMWAFSNIESFVDEIFVRLGLHGDK